MSSTPDRHGAVRDLAPAAQRSAHQQLLIDEAYRKSMETHEEVQRLRALVPERSVWCKRDDKSTWRVEHYVSNSSYATLISQDGTKKLPLVGIEKLLGHEWRLINLNNQSRASAYARLRRIFTSSLKAVVN
jgi:hypothetical protein